MVVEGSVPKLTSDEVRITEAPSIPRLRRGAGGSRGPRVPELTKAGGGSGGGITTTGSVPNLKSAGAGTPSAPSIPRLRRGAGGADEGRGPRVPELTDGSGGSGGGITPTGSVPNLKSGDAETPSAPSIPRLRRGGKGADEGRSPRVPNLTKGGDESPSGITITRPTRGGSKGDGGRPAQGGLPEEMKLDDDGISIEDQQELPDNFIPLPGPGRNKNGGNGNGDQDGGAPQSEIRKAKAYVDTLRGLRRPLEAGAKNDLERLANDTSIPSQVREKASALKRDVNNLVARINKEIDRAQAWLEEHGAGGPQAVEVGGGTTGGRIPNLRRANGGDLPTFDPQNSNVGPDPIRDPTRLFTGFSQTE